MSDDQSPVFFHSHDDPAFDTAAQRARGSFNIFWRELTWDRRRIVKGVDIACVKFAFADPPVAAGQEQPPVEQMWVEGVDFDGQFLHGTLLNSPNWLTSVREGDAVKVSLNQLNDWMYTIDGLAYGGFSVNAMRARMNRAERTDHDAAWGLEFGNPAEIRLVPERLVADAADPFAASCSLPFVQAREHPMALNMVQKLEQLISEDPSLLIATDEFGRTNLHHLASAGTTAGVDVLLRHGADPNARSIHGITALELASILGWNDVVSRLQAN